MNEMTLQWQEADHNFNHKISDRQPSKNPGTIRIGRDPALCDIVVTNPTVSALHIEIFFSPDRHCFCVRSLRSNNPPIVDGQRLEQEDVKLELNSSICLGQIQMKVVNISLPIAATQLFEPVSEVENQLENKVQQLGSSPLPSVNNLPSIPPAKQNNFLKTAFTIPALGILVYFGVAILGPLLPLIIIVWIWQNNSVFTKNKKMIIIITGVIFGLELLMSLRFGWSGSWWFNLIGIGLLVAALPSENGKISLKPSSTNF